jgi:hypothetical protein
MRVRNGFAWRVINMPSRRLADEFGTMKWDMLHRPFSMTCRMLRNGFEKRPAELMLCGPKQPQGGRGIEGLDEYYLQLADKVCANTIKKLIMTCRYHCFKIAEDCIRLIALVVATGFSASFHDGRYPFRCCRYRHLLPMPHITLSSVYQASI